MHAHEYRVAPEVFAAHPQYCRGVIVFDGVDNRTPAAALVTLLREAEAGAAARVSGNVAEFAQVAAWREAYRRFGAKPSEHRSSIEAMLRRVRQPSALPSINPLVDIGNLVSLRHLLPAGVHPLPASAEPMALRAAREGDRFVPADGAPEESPPPGEIVFARGAQVLTRRWTWRQAAGTQTLPETRAVFFNIDGLPPTARADVVAAMDDLRALVAAHCGGRVVAAAVLDAAAPLMTWRD